ncbi:MAG: GTPase [Thermovenabulum sp.]|uniref:GTPase n=1 Tax=Thermovenabulum sp. TaxID=3100335 RepID=UPI003C79C8E2
MNLNKTKRIKIKGKKIYMHEGSDNYLKQCAVVGKPNVGKTLFVINFSEFLGIKELEFEVTAFNGMKMIKKYSIKKAIEELVDDNPHKTRQIHSIIVNLPLNKGKKTIKFIDTIGFTDGIHPEQDIRRAISQTLQVVQAADIIFHIIDASAIEKKLPNSIGEIDLSIAQFAEIKKGYCILANKIDLLEGKENLERLKEQFKGNLIIPISAKYKKGFKEVRAFVINAV